MHIYIWIDQLGKSIRKNDQECFGGIQIIVVGDFLQLPPVRSVNNNGINSGMWCINVWVSEWVMVVSHIFMIGYKWYKKNSLYLNICFYIYI